MDYLLLTAAHTPATMRAPTTFHVRGILAGVIAAACGALLLKVFPSLETELFIGGASRLAGLLAGVAAVRVDEGWALVFPGQPLMVTAACSATDFALMTAALLGWHFARRAERAALLPAAAAGALIVAVPLAITVNALRLVAVAQAHRWVIPRMPEAYGHFLHMLTGVAVFLPALIGMNLLLEFYGRSRIPARD